MGEEEAEARSDRRVEPLSSIGDYIGGRIGRLEYWIWFALVMAAALCLALVHALEFAAVLQFGLLIQQNRRLHDFNRSGWWAVLFVIGPVIVLRLLALFMPQPLAMALSTLAGLAIAFGIGTVAGDSGENRFGTAPARNLRGIFFEA